jgi:hypothetical protein
MNLRFFIHRKGNRVTIHQEDWDKLLTLLASLGVSVQWVVWPEEPEDLSWIQIVIIVAMFVWGCFFGWLLSII